MHEIDLCGQPLDMDLTLACGQAFRWTRDSQGVWTGVVRESLVKLHVEGDVLRWRTFPEEDADLVIDYLRLRDDVGMIYERLSEADSHMAELVRRFRGLRLVRQDPAETLLSFVCSAANSIPRISAAIEALSERYGRLVCQVNGLCYYTFPTIEAVAGCADCLLQSTSLLGFRDRVLRDVARQVIDRGGSGWLAGLRAASYEDARDQLTELRGVGRKIADCVCLFALDKDEAVPVDTHIRQIAARFWMPDLTTKGLTAAGYQRIVDEFRRRYGGLSGWAQQFFYYEDLLRPRTLRN